MAEDTTPRCQSCGRILNLDVFGSNASGSMNFDYCKHCFQKGAFVNPDVTLPQMVELSAEHLGHEMDIETPEAIVFASQLLPTLKRWRSSLT